MSKEHGNRTAAAEILAKLQNGLNSASGKQLAPDSLCNVSHGQVLNGRGGGQRKPGVSHFIR